MAKKSKDTRIKKAKENFRSIFHEVEEDSKILVDTLIDRAAFMSVTIEDWEEDVNRKGNVEMFQQSPSVPAYERERPVVKQLNAMTKTYAAVLKQLKAELPGEQDMSDDEFRDFLNRDD